MTALGDILKRVLSLEAQQKTSSTEIANLKNEIDSLKRQLNQLSTKHDSDISDVKSSIQQMDAKIQQAYSRAYNDARNSLLPLINKNTGDISALNNKYNALLNRVLTTTEKRDIMAVVGIFRSSPAVDMTKIERAKNLVSSDMYSKIKYMSDNLGNDRTATSFIRSKIDISYIDGLGFIRSIDYRAVWDNIKPNITTGFIKNRGFTPNAELFSRIKGLGFLDRTGVQTELSNSLNIDEITKPLNEAQTIINDIKRMRETSISYTIAGTGTKAEGRGPIEYAVSAIRAAGECIKNGKTGAARDYLASIVWKLRQQKAELSTFADKHFSVISKLRESIEGIKNNLTRVKTLTPARAKR